MDNPPPKTPNLEACEAILFEVMKSFNDLQRLLKEHYLWDKDFPWSDVSQLGEMLKNARYHIRPHELWDLTNDPAYAASIKKTLEAARRAQIRKS